MGKRILYSLIFLVLIVIPTKAIAQTVTPIQTIKTQLQDLRTQQQSLIAEQKALMASKTAEFKARIAAIKDERKKLLAQKITDHVTTANTNSTNRMTKALDTMQAIIDRAKTKSSELKTQGKDTTALDTAITNAQAAVNAARTAVSNQAAKQYTVDIPTDSLLKNAIGKLVSGFRQDISNTYSLVVAAKQAVAKVFTELAKFKVQSNEASSSAHTQ